MSVALELLRGRGLESFRCEHGAAAAPLPEWREFSRATGEDGLKTRQECPSGC